MEVDHDCTINCKLTQHGNLITAALTKHQIDEEKLIKFLVLTCKNFSKICDTNGRTALMLACSNAKPLVTEFLLNQGANYLAKDFESQQNAMHRACHYGWIENILILKKFGASFDTFDADFLTPLQMIPYSCQYSAEHLAYVFGKNKNYNLGIGNVTSRNYPDLIKSLPSMHSVSINKFHSLFLTNSGQLFACGVNKEGRLGIGNEATVVNPQEITFKSNYKNERIIAISAGLFHSLVLTQKSVYAAGSNKYFQLGIKNVERALTFSEVNFDRTEVSVHKIHTIIACDYHSVFVSPQGVYICGLNVGQFGGIQESVPYPRVLSNPVPGQKDLTIKWAQSNNCCICVYATHKEMNYFTVYYNRRVKSYKNPLMEGMEQCAIIGGELNYNSDEIMKNSSQKPLFVTILTQYKNLFIWYEDISKFVKVHMSPLFTTQIREFMPCNDGLLIDADEQLFTATIQHKLTKMYQLNSEYQEFHSKRDIAEFLCSKILLKRVQNVSNVSAFVCDADGESFITIMNHRTVKTPEFVKENFDFTVLLDDYQFETSGIMDVTFIVKNETFKANKFIVFTRCEILKNFIQKDGSICTIEDPRMTPEMFKCILIWIYKNNLTNDELNDVIKHTKDENTIKAIVQDFHDITIEFNLNGVYNAIVTHFSNLIKRPDRMNIKSFRWFSLENLPDLYDVTILLDENQELRAHKVVLMMRIEYFKMMFYHSWSENSVVDLKHISINFMRPIIQFAYDNNIEALRTANYGENFIYNMIAICDQYLIINLKEIFEILICERISLKNCAENLDFAIAYNCEILKKFCMEFITLNLARLLEGNFLDNLEPMILKELSFFYRKFFHFEDDSNYNITPAFDAPTEEEIDELIKDFNLELYCNSQKVEKKTPKSKTRLSKSEITKRNIEKEGKKELQKEIKDSNLTEPQSPKTPETPTEENQKNSWQKNQRERKDSTKNKKILTAIKCNEILKNETVKQEPMVDLRNLKISDNNFESSETVQRNAITLADFGIISSGKKKKSLSFSESTTAQSPTQQKQPEIVKMCWNMDKIELKPLNTADTNPFLEPTPSTSNSKKQKPQKSKSLSNEKNFSKIIKDERKEKQQFEKIKSKSLILTQIEERAITELSEFYNIDNIFDEDITISRKVQIASQNLSQWHNGIV
ncbi:hypothetical protein PVAND_012425 [Polypedilum vanderplanki]|uniref:BTB domain-containing protein n=1 Tax=Polypedilum vanderplanki TaxID=319348 RepID=A0A9J6CMD7_POLVA|nr:hypothetical protein PVAND_012425 [Polypedilum vanderplanki]